MSATIDAKLLEAMGINPSQVEKKVTQKKITSPSTKTEALKVDCKVEIGKLNKQHGNEVKFTALVRNGKNKEGKPLYKVVNMSSDFVVEKSTEKEGMFTASRGVYYTETFLIADFTIIGSNSDTSKEVIPKKK